MTTCNMLLSSAMAETVSFNSSLTMARTSSADRDEDEWVESPKSCF